MLWNCFWSFLVLRTSNVFTWKSCTCTIPKMCYFYRYRWIRVQTKRIHWPSLTRYVMDSLDNNTTKPNHDRCSLRLLYWNRTIEVVGKCGYASQVRWSITIYATLPSKIENDCRQIPVPTRLLIVYSAGLRCKIYFGGIIFFSFYDRTIFVVLTISVNK